MIAFTGLIINTIGFIYFLFWVAIMPLLETENPLMAMFPLGQNLALKIPLFFMVTGISAISLFVGIYVIVEEVKRRNEVKF
jgi:multisubunit Na+/H+ antiporter MnhB subunit